MSTNDYSEVPQSLRDRIAALEAELRRAKEANDSRYTITEIEGTFFVTRRGTDIVVAEFEDYQRTADR